MTKATKDKLNALTQKVNVLSSSSQEKENMIKYLLIGIAVLAVVVFYFVLIRKRGRK